MSTMQTKSLNTPDEVRTLPKTTVEVIIFGELSLIKLTFQPGWRWSEHMKPTAGTESYQLLPPGHDAWIVGDEPYVTLDFQRGHLYARSSR